MYRARLVSLEKEFMYTHVLFSELHSLTFLDTVIALGICLSMSTARVAIDLTGNVIPLEVRRQACLALFEAFIPIIGSRALQRPSPRQNQAPVFRRYKVHGELP